MTTRPTSRPSPRPPRQPVLRLRDPAGVVAAVPYLLGFVPRRSLVVIGVDDEQGVGATLRTDLPTSDLVGTVPPTVLPDAWDHAVQVLLRNGCARALVVLYGDVDPVDLPDDAARRLLDRLDPGGRGAEPDLSDRQPAAPDVLDVLDVLDVHDVLDVLDVLLVGPTRFRSLRCPDPSCCPREGLTLEVTGSHPVAASFVLAGRVAAPGRDDVEPVPPTADPVETATAAASTERSRLTGGGEGPAASEVDALLEEWLGCLPGGPSPELAGRLAWGWRSSPRLRDACLAAFLPGGPALARALLGAGPWVGPAAGPWRGRTTAPPGGGRGSLTGSLEDPGCSVAVREGGPVLRRMAALVPAPERADVLAAHAWLSWASGEGTAAVVLAERALAVDAGQSLARLVLQCLDHGLGAPWTVAARPARPGRARRRGLR